MRLLSMLAAAMVLLAGCAELGDIYDAEPSPPIEEQVAELEVRIFRLIQDERRKIDPEAKVLVLDSLLIGAARERARDMATKSYFAHKGPDGRVAADTLMERDPAFHGLLGENIAMQYYAKGAGIDAEAFARRFVETWLASPEHRKNLAFTHYDRTGVGAAANGEAIYVAQLFLTDLGMKPAAQPREEEDAGMRTLTPNGE